MTQPEPQTQAQRLIEYLRQHPLIRTRELSDIGIPRSVLERLVASGDVERVARGLYALPDANITEAHGLVQAQALVPQGVICLLSALSYHGLTTQTPFEVWIAIDRKAWRPQFTHPPMRIVRFSGEALTQGVGRHHIEGRIVSITTPARTVADCFKYRNKVGLDVALEALNDFRKKRAGTIEELWKAARLNRVTRTLQPYLEATR